MACCLPCFRKLQKQLDPVPGTGPFTLCVTESVRWVAIVVPLYLSVWRYAELRGYQHWFPEADVYAQFWGVVSAIILGLSLFIYAPFKIVALRYRVKHNKLKDYKWRPSVLAYIFVCVLPCLVIILLAAKTQSETESSLDPVTSTVLQIVVMGLTITEWMAKMREEHLSYDLVTAMTVDFFFAYDIIEFLMLPTKEDKIFHSNWVYVCFAFTFLAMFKYVPNQPVSIYEHGAPKGAAINILVSLFLMDLPFVIVRVWTMAEFGVKVSDLIHPVKNILLILFDLTQLYIIYKNQKQAKKKHSLKYSEKRIARYPCVWSEENGTMHIGECKCSPGGDPVLVDPENLVSAKASRISWANENAAFVSNESTNAGNTSDENRKNRQTGEGTKDVSITDMEEVEMDDTKTNSVVMRIKTNNN